MRGFADQRDAALAQTARSCSIASGNRWRPGSTPNAAENGMRLRFSAASDNSSSPSARQPFGFLRCRRPTPRCSDRPAAARTRRALRGVKLGRDIPMRPRMADIEGQRGLVEVAVADRDAGGLARQRLPPVGADHKPRRQRCPAGGADGDDRLVRLDRLGLIVEPRQVRKFGGALLPAPPSARGSRCCSRTGRGRFPRDENLHLRRADQPAGVVDQPHGL